MKKFLTLSVLFISFLLIYTSKTHAQIIPELCLFEINNDSSDFSGYPNETIYIDGLATLNEPASPPSGVVTFELRFKKTFDGDTNYEGLYVEVIDLQHFRVYGDFGPSLWGNQNISDTLYFAIYGVHLDLFSGENYAHYYSDFLYVLNPNIITGIQNSLKVEKNDFKLYPNPATDILTIEHPGASEFAIYDLTGNLVHKERLASEKQEINVSSLPTGIYFIQIRSGGAETRTKRFQKL